MLTFIIHLTVALELRSRATVRFSDNILGQLSVHISSPKVVDWFFFNSPAFFVSQMFLMHNCRMGEKTFRAARTNYFFLLLLLGTFLMCLAAVVFGVTQ